MNLHAGPLEVTFRGGDLWHLRLGETELVQRVYMALRDQNWGTIAGRLEGLSAEQDERSFIIRFESIHQSGDIDFRWHGTMTGTQDRKITIAMEGKAHSTFLRNRLGFCLHQPLAECKGRPCTIEMADGRKEESAFPEFVAPHQPFLNMRAMTYRLAAGIEVEVRFEGDVFETEDHRNWTDANYKTYGTPPLALPFPVKVAAGSVIRQRIEIAVRGEAKAAPRAADKAVRVREAGGAPLPLPRLGLGLGRPLSATEAGKLKSLRLSHLRVDLDLDTVYQPLLERAAEEARRLGVRLEAAITLPGDAEALRHYLPLVERWLVFHDGEKVTSAETLQAVRGTLGPKAVLITGTNAYFAELNRNRPAMGDWEAACFSLNPQVHAFDDESVMNNTVAQFDAVKSAQKFLGGKPVAVSPVTLRPRFNPDATSAAEAPPPDPRQKLPFCAAWTASSLKALAEAGASSVTYFETSGPGGVLDTAITYPVFDVFHGVSGFARGEVLPSESSDGARIATLLLASGKRRRMLIANRTDEIVRVEARGTTVELAGYAVGWVDWTGE